MEDFEKDLHKAIAKMKDYSPEKKLWEDLERQLDFDDAIAIGVKKLPQYVPDEGIWSDIEESLPIERQVLPIWWRWVAVFFFISGISLWLVKMEDSSELVITQVVEQKEVMSTDENGLQSESANEDQKDVESTDLVKQAPATAFSNRSIPEVNIQYVAAKDLKTVIKSPVVPDVTIQVFEIKEIEERSHYREVEIVFDTYPQRRKRRESTEKEKLMEKIYEQKRHQGKWLIMEPNMSIVAQHDDEDRNRSKIKFK